MRDATRIVAALLLALGSLAADAGQRAFVSSTGNDANAASGCTAGAPCRSFQAAHAAVDAGGEIVALDTAGYGPVEISKSVAIVGNPGTIPSISVATGSGVSIVAPGVKVALRNLNINGAGGERGIDMGDGASLTIENCVVANFNASFYATAIHVYTSSEPSVRIVGTSVRDNSRGVSIGGIARVDISRSHIMGNAPFGVYVEQGSGAASSIAINDSVVSGNVVGIRNWSYAGTARMSLARTTIANNAGDAVVNRAEGTGTAVLTIGASMVSVNGRGLLNEDAGGTAIFESLGDNILRQNVETSFGTITVVPNT